MTKPEAQRIVDTQDYQPWALVARAKEILGIADDTDPQVERLCDELRARRAQRKAKG